MLEILDEISQENGWDNFSDLVFKSKYRRSIMSVVEKANESFKEK